MFNEYKYDIFLSFSSLDQEIAKKYYDYLNNIGLKIFWSDKTLIDNMGKSYFSIIQNALINSKHLLVILSSNSEKSNWVREEYETFYNQCYMKSDGTRRLFLINIGATNIKIAPFLMNIQQSKSIEEIGDVILGTKSDARENNTETYFTTKEKIINIFSKNQKEENIEHTSLQRKNPSINSQIASNNINHLLVFLGVTILSAIIIFALAALIPHWFKLLYGYNSSIHKEESAIILAAMTPVGGLLGWIWGAGFKSFIAGILAWTISFLIIFPLIH